MSDIEAIEAVRNSLASIYVPERSNVESLLAAYDTQAPELRAARERLAEIQKSEVVAFLCTKPDPEKAPHTHRIVTFVHHKQDAGTLEKAGYTTTPLIRQPEGA